MALTQRAVGIHPEALEATGVIFNAGYFLWTIQRMFLGPVNEKYAKLPEITKWEAAPLAALAVVILVAQWGGEGCSRSPTAGGCTEPWHPRCRP
jgi:NADH:ubiquinone oxidoreductase subunit 4 (subunit M)